MGDIPKKSMAEKAAEREQRKKEIVHHENSTIDKYSRKKTRKDRAISARVNDGTYSDFKRICEERGLTSNAVINMLITDFVRENRFVLEGSEMPKR